MNFKLTEEAKAALLQGRAEFIKKGSLRFDGFQVSVNEAHDVDVTFFYKGLHVGTLRGPYVNFDSGDTLTVTDLKGKIGVTLE